MSIAHVDNGNTEGTQVAVVSAPQKKSLLVAMAAKYDMEPARFKQTVMATCFDAKGTEDELIAFLIVAHRYGLCPFRREIYAFPKKGGGIQPVVGVDGWASIMNRHPEMDGIEFEYEHDEKGNLVAVTSIIYRKDRSRPCKVTEWLDECRRNTEPWNQWTRRMLRHKAMIQGARVAFSISGIMDEEEAQEMVRRGKLEKPANYEMANVIDVKPEGRASLTNELMDHEPPAEQEAPADEPPRTSLLPEADDLIEGCKRRLAKCRTAKAVDDLYDDLMSLNPSPEDAALIDQLCSTYKMEKSWV